MNRRDFLGTMTAGTMGRNVTSLAFSRDGSVLASGGIDGSASRAPVSIATPKLIMQAIEQAVLGRGRVIGIDVENTNYYNLPGVVTAHVDARRATPGKPVENDRRQQVSAKPRASRESLRAEAAHPAARSDSSGRAVPTSSSGIPSA